MGIDILWLMPIHPIGEKNRKGTLGSPYSVKDYYGVNPEFGTEEDFRAFVDAAHELGMRVILDLGLRTTRPGITHSLNNTPSGTRAIGAVSSIRHPGGTGRTLLILTTPSPAFAST